MSYALLVLLLTAVWTAVTGVVTVPNLLLGFLIGALAVWLVRDRVPAPALPGRLGRIAALGALFVIELARSTVRVAALVLSPGMKGRLRPGFLAFPLSVTSDWEIAVLANLITLTPGTLSVDVSEDRRLLYIHALDARDKEAIIADLKTGFEARVLEAFR